MKQRIWLFGLLLAVPIVGFGVAVAIQAHFNSELRAALHQQYPDASPEKIDTITVEQLCEHSRADLAEFCDTNDNLTLMRHAALGASVVGVLLLVLIRLAGTLARDSRALLASIFGPGLYLTILVLIGLVVVHAAVAIGAIYYGESALVNRIHVGIILAIGAGAAFGVLAMIRSTFSIIKKAQTFVIGRSVTREEAPNLWAHIDATADRLGALKPQHVVVGLDPNFFVTEANVLCLTGKLTGRTLYCSLPLCRILTKQEMTSIVGHELGHFKGQDTKFSERFYPVYRGTATSLASLQAVGGEGSGAIALLPAVAVLSYFLESFTVAESRLSRERELAADQAGAQVATPQAIASALVKVHAFTGYWNGLQEAAADALRKGQYFVNASKTYAEVCVKNAGPNALEGVADTHTNHPTDSHPSLSLRLQSLKTALADVSASALNVSPSDPAVSFIPDHEKQEEEISHAYQLLLARQLGINLEESHAQQPESA